jgi:hypothetical protein
LFHLLHELRVRRQPVPGVDPKIQHASNLACLV